VTNVSVIIPTWNRANTIERALRSSLAQSASPLEVLVCDDGSTDNTRELVLSIGDSRARWIDAKRSGRPAIPRNRGIQSSRGEWLAFLDSDDEWLPDKLEKQLAVAEESGCMAVCSNALRFVAAKGDQGPLLSLGKERLTFNDLVDNNRVICSSVSCGLIYPVREGIPVMLPEEAQRP